MRAILILASICCLSYTMLNSQNFISRYGNNSDPAFSAITTLPDGTILSGGSAFNNGANRALLAALGPAGNPLWARYYGGEGGAWGVASLQPAADGNLIALFNVSLFGGFNSLSAYSVVAKISRQNGTVIWSRRMGDDTIRGVFFQIRSVADGYVLCGGVEELNQRASFCLAKIGEDGSLAWQQAYQKESLLCSFTAIDTDETGQLWALGRSSQNGNLVDRAVLARFSPDGLLEQATTYTSSDPGRLFDGGSLAVVPGRGPAIGGGYIIPGPAQSQPLVFQADPNGNVLWARVLETPPGLYFTPLLVSTSGPGMLVGCAGAGGGPLGLLARLDDDGAVSWAHSLTSNWGVESLFALTTDAAENLLGVGQVFAPLPQIGSEGFVFKTDDLRFNAPSCCTQAEPLSSQPVALEATAVSLEEGLTFSLNDVSVSQLTAFLTTTPVCQEEAAPTIVLSDTLICPGQCIEVSATGVPAGATPRWIFPGGAPDTVDIAGPVTACFDQAGDYQIQLIVDNCSRAARLLKVEQQTPPAFTLSDSLICPGECLETSAPSPPEGLSYVWVFQGAEPDSSFATTPPPACYPEGGQYRIELWYEGCGQTSQTVNVRYLPPGIPNAFTPNGDGLNDTFSPIFTCEVDNYDLQVYNRWGQKIFQSNQPADSWDGAFEGKPAHSEVYFWMLSYNEVLNGQVVGQKMQGDVTLLR